jgi:D-arabinose 1-dehydrogenase-like Zn-dependent alcohol dehydrogenase
VRGRHVLRWGDPTQPAELPDPVPAEGEVLVRVEACGIGLTVLNCIAGHLGNDPDDLPRVPGHELVGTVVEAGAGVRQDLVGRRVAAYFYLFCGACPACLAAREPRCERLGGFVGVHRDGGYAEQVVLPARNAVPLPAGLDPVSATAIPDAIATPVHVAGRAAIRPGDRVAVIAAGGGVGVHMVQVAQVHGAEVSALEASATKLAWLAEELGASPIDSSDFAAARLPSAWRQGADVVVDLLGTPASLRWALDHLAPGGRLVALTTFPGVEVAVSPRELVFAEASVVGSRYASRHELVRAAELVAAGRVRPVIGERVGVDEVERAHDNLRRGALLGRGALVWEETA